MEVQDIIKGLTADEKIRLFNGEGSWHTFGSDNRLPQICMSDGPHGLRKQDKESYSDINNSNIATCFPTASCLASSWNKNTLAAVGKAIALEAHKENVNIVLGPGTNIKRSPLCGRNFEYFSEDPYLAGTLASEYINSMQAQGVGTSLKHFACNNQEKRRQTSNSIVDERTLNEIYLRAFEIAVKNSQPVSIMCSYNRLNGEYTGNSRKLLTDTLRNKWGFKGFVVSDWGACMSAPECVKNGMDLAMPDSFGYFGKELKKAIAQKIISEADIEKANSRILEAAVKLNANHVPIEVDYKQQHQTALHLAEDCAVLLKNDGILPLKKQKVAVIGELAEYMRFQGGGSSHISTADYPNAVQALGSEGYEVVYSKGYYSGFCSQKKAAEKNRKLIQEAVEAVRKAAEQNLPVLYFCGLTDTFEGEGFDRENLNLPQEQLELLEKILSVTDNVAVISFSGSPIAFPFADKVKAILHMYLCGEACGEACASLISGKTNPSGKLAETFPYKVEDTPCYRNFAPDEDNVPYKEGIFTGYRYYESKNIPVQYEFGFGLSYTTFEYSDLSVELPNVTFSIKNTGSVAGSEVAEVYVVNPKNDNRAVKELRGYAKVYLQPGEKKSVTIELDENAFKVYSATQEKFVRISGEYEIQAASSIKKVHLTQKVQINGIEFDEAVKPVPDSFYEEKRISVHSKGGYTINDSLSVLADSSFRIRMILKTIEKVAVLTCKGRSKEDPAVKITLSAIRENPLVSIISTSGGMITEKFARKLVQWANR